MKPVLFVLLILTTKNTVAQGGIDMIKNQPYMKLAHIVNCQNQDNELTAKICANLEFQKADSLLTITYNNLLQNCKNSKESKLAQKIISLQNKWRVLRDLHCGIVWDLQGTQAGTTKVIEYLNCLTEMTKNRTQELQNIYRSLVF